MENNDRCIACGHDSNCGQKLAATEAELKATVKTLMEDRNSRKERISKHVANIFGGVAFGVLVGFTCLYIGATIGMFFVKTEAIERGFAEYNSFTGVWQWKEKK